MKPAIIVLAIIVLAIALFNLGLEQIKQSHLDFKQTKQLQTRCYIDDICINTCIQICDKNYSLCIEELRKDWDILYPDIIEDYCGKPFHECFNNCNNVECKICKEVPR